TRQAAERLRNAPRPIAAALALAALRDPAVLDDKIESVGARGFGDDKLDALAQELVRLRYESEALNSDAALRHLQSRGFTPDMLKTLEHDARRAGVAAPFLQETGERARELWRQAYDLLMELESLERAVEAATRDLDRDRDSSTLISLKADRDLKRRLLNSDWSSDEAEKPVLPH
ncbi:MAG: DNA primase, partial [Alphaproteobacteria bacterium]|nr:DNA primase [Alphaproteobacteria bacterium]